MAAGGVLAVIPARQGSRGIPGKNIRPFLGRPLLAWTVEAAKESGACDRIVLSTDGAEVAEIGRQCGAVAPFLRPTELAGDAAPTAPVIRHAVDWFAAHERWTPELVVVLEPTSPSRRGFHIREAIARLRETGADSLASVTEVPHHYHPDVALARQADGTLVGMRGTPVIRLPNRRQDLPACYAFNGLIWACRTEIVRRDPPTLWGERVQSYVVEPRYSIDLDRPEDWAAAEARCQELMESDTQERGGRGR